MSKFTVLEIMDACTIRVQPNWVFRNKGEELSGNIVKISLLEERPSNNEYVKAILIALLKDREVLLYRPQLANRDTNAPPQLVCQVLLDDTDLMYYFTKTNSRTKKPEFFLD